jgi:HAMP domain-containing protein
MKASDAIARAAWWIVAVVLVIAAVNLVVLRRAEPLLGLWDADYAGRYQMPAPVVLDEQLAAELFRDKPLVLVPGTSDTPTSNSCRELFRYYGLDASRLETASRAGNPQSPCAPGQSITIPLDSDR